MTLHDFTDLRLDDLDRDGALREAADGLERTSRAGFFIDRGGRGRGCSLVVRAPAASAALAKSDVVILNYALTLEYLQDAFYTESERKGALSGPAARLAQVVGAVERAHVQALRGVLGKQAVKRPFFDFL